MNQKTGFEQYLVVSSIRQGSINWLVCIYCGDNVMIFWGLTELLSFQNINAKPTFLW